MRRKTTLPTVVPFFLLLATAAWGQAAVPGPMVGEMPASGFQSDTSLTNVFLGSLTASSIFDDNANNSSSHRIAGEQYYLATSVALQQTRRHLRWNLSYRPAVGLGTHTTLRNQFNQMFGTTVGIDPTARLSLQLRADYMITTDPFDQFGEAPLQAGIGPLERPNDSAVLSQLKRTSVFSGTTLSYRLSRHTTVGVSGSYGIQRYGDYHLSAGSALMNSRAATGEGFLSHQFSRRYTSGIEYQMMNLEFSALNMHTLTHSVLSFHEFALSPNNSLVLFAGPEYSHSHDQLMVNLLFFEAPIPVFRDSWSPAAGAVYTLNGMHTSFQASYTRRVSDGGGLLGAVRMNSGTVGVTRKLANRWKAGITTAATQERPLNPGEGSQLRILRAGANVGHELAPNMSIRLAYDRLYQHGSLLGYNAGNHNRVTFSIERSLSKPLGR